MVPRYRRRRLAVSRYVVQITKKVDLSYVNPGDNVTVQVSEGLAITVERP